MDNDATALQSRFETGVALQREGRLEEAATIYRTVLDAAPNATLAHHNLGLIQLTQQRFDAAAESFRTALQLQPGWPEARMRYANALLWLGRLTEAEQHCRHALHLAPTLTPAYAVLSAVLAHLGHFEAALGAARIVLQAQPDDADALNLAANALKDLGRLEEAETLYREALRRDPDNPNTNYNLAALHLMAGRFAEAWDQHEHRWRMTRVPQAQPPMEGPLWQGQPDADGLVLLYGEQGLGDTIQFCRYAPLVADRMPVALVVPPELGRLMRTLGPRITVLSDGETTVAYTVQCPLMSLPRAFGTTLDTIPAAMPYLHADPAQVAAWQDRLAGRDGLRVGLVWGGNPGNPANHRRSIPFARLAPLLDQPGLCFVSLQKQRQKETPDHPRLLDWTAELDDLADTAALIAALDLVIGVDTAVIHLAGALGKPVWLLNRFDTDWRWMRGRTDSPWYPTLRLFRQDRPGDWDGVIARVGQALEAGDARSPLWRATGGQG